MTRDEKISAICDRYVNSILANNAADEWMSNVILYGQVGLESMTDDEIDKEYEIWFGDDNDEAV